MLIKRALLKKEEKEIVIIIFIQNNFIFQDQSGKLQIKVSKSFQNYKLSDYYITKKYGANRRVDTFNLKEGDKLIVNENLEKTLYHKDIVKMKISIPYNRKILKNSENYFSIELKEGDIKFDKPEMTTIINNKPFLKFLKDSFVACQIFGVLYFSYKIISGILKNREEQRKNKNKNVLALPDK